MRRLSIRWKLTLWYGGVLTLVLALFSAAVFFTMRHQLLGRIDQGLNEEMADVLFEVERAGDERGLSNWLNRRFAQHEGFDFQITLPDGERFFVNPRLQGTVLPLPQSKPLSRNPTFHIFTHEDGRRWRVISVQVPGPKESLIVQVARSLDAFDRESEELLFTFLLTGPLTLTMVVAGGYFLARRALAPVDQITATANQITAERLSQRVRVANPDDELGALANTLNCMIERLEQSFTEMQRFTADAAHELRTPLAVMRAEAEVALRATRTPEHHVRTLENILEEINRLSYVAEELLLLSRRDAGLAPPTNEQVDVDSLLTEVIENVRLVAQERDVSLILGAASNCWINSDPHLLRRVLYNLLDNAIKHTPPKGEVRVEGAMREGILEIVVADTGSGIPEDVLPRVFERFYRGDASRSKEGEGAGLGLAICRSFVSVIGGTICIQSKLGKGTRVLVRLPIPSFDKASQVTNIASP